MIHLDLGRGRGGDVEAFLLLIHKMSNLQRVHAWFGVRGLVFVVSGSSGI
jgi:hypothetical protein